MSCGLCMRNLGSKHLLLGAAGLMGGHSGLNINEDRGNAVRFVAQVTNAVLKAAPNARLARISGGDKRNAIAREASAQIVVCPPCLADKTAVLSFLSSYLGCRGLRLGADLFDLERSMTPRLHSSHQSAIPCLQTDAESTL